MKRLLILFLFALPALACNLGASSTSATPTYSVAPVLSQATLGLSPVAGPPGSIVNISAAGFPAGARVNLYISTISKPSTIPVNTLTVSREGVLVYALQIPQQIDNVPIQNNSPIVFTLTADSGSPGASALYLAIAQTGVQPTATPFTNAGGTGGGNTAGTYNDLFITSPAINSLQAGNSMTITGSGSSYTNQVTVQVQDGANNILGSAVATIQAAAGYVGPWQATVTFTQPSAQQYGYIVAVTSEGKQASIPILLAGAGVPPPAAGAVPLYPTLPVQATKLFN